MYWGGRRSQKPSFKQREGGKNWKGSTSHYDLTLLNLVRVPLKPFHLAPGPATHVLAGSEIIHKETPLEVPVPDFRIPNHQICYTIHPPLAFGPEDSN